MVETRCSSASQRQKQIASESPYCPRLVSWIVSDELVQLCSTRAMCTFVLCMLSRENQNAGSAGIRSLKLRFELDILQFMFLSVRRLLQWLFVAVAATTVSQHHCT